MKRAIRSDSDFFPVLRKLSLVQHKLNPLKNERIIFCPVREEAFAAILFPILCQGIGAAAINNRI